MYQICSTNLQSLCALFLIHVTHSTHLLIRSSYRSRYLNDSRYVLGGALTAAAAGAACDAGARGASGARAACRAAAGGSWPRKTPSSRTSSAARPRSVSAPPRPIPPSRVCTQ